MRMISFLCLLGCFVCFIVRKMAHLKLVLTTVQLQVADVTPRQWRASLHATFPGEVPAASTCSETGSFL